MKKFQFMWDTHWVAFSSQYAKWLFINILGSRVRRLDNRRNDGEDFTL